MKINTLAIILLALLINTNAIGQQISKEQNPPTDKIQNIFSVDGEYRSRFENMPIDGSNILVKEKSGYQNLLGQRARLMFNYSSKKIETKLSFQDVRYFGANKQYDKIWSSTNGIGFSVHEAWGKYNFTNNNNKKTGVKIGRQEIDFMDPRIMATKNWSHQAAAYDAIIFQEKNKEFNLAWNVGFAYNSVDFIGTANPYRFLGIANFKKKIADIITLEFNDLYEDFEQDKVFANGGQDSTYYRNTIGFTHAIEKWGVKLYGSVYYQHGLQKNLNDITRAYMASPNVSYTYDEKYSIAFGYDYYSGRAKTDSADMDIYKVFEVPYSTYHPYFGYTNFNKTIISEGYGMQDIHLAFKAKLPTKTTIELAAHRVSYVKLTTYFNATGKKIIFTNVGHDIGLQIKQKFGKNVEVSVAYSALLPSTEYVEYTLGNGVNAEMPSYFWLMFDFKPNLFNSAKYKTHKL